VMILLMGGAAVVVKDMTSRPKAVSYTLPSSKPATQPAFDASHETLAGWLLDTVPVLDKKALGEPLVVVAPACTHLENNPKSAATACVACHTAPTNNGVNRVNLNTGTLNIAADKGMIYLARNLQGMLVLDNGNLVAGKVLVQLVDNNGLAAGADAPAIDVKQADGTKLTLGDLKGKFVLLHFWDSTSKESAEQMPHLRAAHKDWGNEPKLVILGINVDEKPDVATAFAKEQKMEWLQGYAGPGSKLMQDYHVGVGAAVLMGPDGKIINGSLSGLAIDDALDKALRPQ
jgi:peroxiredoxin/cytochrome c553